MSSVRRDFVDVVPLRGFRQARPPKSTEAYHGSMLSIVIPAKDEAANLASLMDEIVKAFRPMVGRVGDRHRLDGFEVLVVDDGSTDGTADLLQELEQTYPELRCLTLVRSFGQSAATVAGFRASRGDWVGMLDADLQNLPSDLARLWEALPGHDAALGWRMTREDSWIKRKTSLVANRVRNIVLGQSIRDTGCSVRIIAKSHALRLPAFQGAHRFFGPLLIREGARIVQMPVVHRPRVRGKSHYHFGNRSFRVIVDLLGVAWLSRRAIGYELAAEPEVSRIRIAEEEPR